MPGLAAKIVVIPSGIDRDRLASAQAISAADWRARLGIDASAVAIGLVGAVSSRKQQVQFVRRTMPAITAAGDWRVHVLGDDYLAQQRYVRRFRTVSSQSALARRIVHPGFTPEMFGWYRALDLVVVASTHEGLARAMIEAVASGTPVVSFDVCSAREVLDEGGGVVVAAQDFAALAAELSDLIDDPGRRRVMAEAAALTGARFDSRLTGLRYRELYASMLADRASRTRRRGSPFGRAAPRIACASATAGRCGSGAPRPEARPGPAAPCREPEPYPRTKSAPGA
jgi:glycosyltransferase involved in cell wall biosynthesis